MFICELKSLYGAFTGLTERFSFSEGEGAVDFHVMPWRPAGGLLKTRKLTLRRGRGKQERQR